jgi:GMP synthase (glutamine-hydrolysing)
MKKTLIISLCKEKMHEEEFVLPIVEILGRDFCMAKHYLDMNLRDLSKINQIILSGTSLQDFQYLQDIKKFEWLLDIDKPVLGICAGMQVIVKVFGGSLKKRQEIGVVEVKMKKEFFGLPLDFKAYTLHNLSAENSKDFEVFGRSAKDIHFIKHSDKNIFGVMFHPEVLQKVMLWEFAGRKV